MTIEKALIFRNAASEHLYPGFFAVRKWRIWNYFRDYFPIRLIKTVDLDPTRSYLFGYHPHGIFAVGAFCSFVTDAAGFNTLFPGLTSYLLTLRCFFFYPYLREVMLFGGLSVASKENIESSSASRRRDSTNRKGRRGSDRWRSRSSLRAPGRRVNSLSQETRSSQKVPATRRRSSSVFRVWRE